MEDDAAKRIVEYRAKLQKTLVEKKKSEAERDLGILLIAELDRFLGNHGFNLIIDPDTESVSWERAPEPKTASTVET